MSSDVELSLWLNLGLVRPQEKPMGRNWERTQGSCGSEGWSREQVPVTEKQGGQASWHEAGRKVS